MHVRVWNKNGTCYYCVQLWLYVSEQTADIVASERDEWKVQIPIWVLTMPSAGQR